MAAGPAEKPPYVARFRRATVIVMILAAPGSLAGLWTLMAAGVLTHHRGGVGLLVAVPALGITGLGIGRLVRGLISGWTALAVDAEGIYFGAGPHERPQRYSWDEISALVLFARRTEFVQGTVQCVGVRLHPCTVRSPERHLQEVDRALAGSLLSPRERQELTRLRDFDREAAVSFHVEVRGWRRRPARLREAMRAHAPGVPILQRSSADFSDLVAWRAGGDLLSQVAQSPHLG